MSEHWRKEWLSDQEYRMVCDCTCTHCHDNPPRGHDCPACGRPATDLIAQQEAGWLTSG